MPSAIAGLPSTPTKTSTTGGTKTLSSADFLNLMIQQLSQQDPMNPTDSNQLLTQMSQISTLQSNSDMQNSLAGLTLQQSIGAGGNLIGKTINGLDSNGNAVKGIVTSVKVNNKQVFLELDSGTTLPMQNVTQITPTSGTSTNALNSLASSLPMLQQLLGATGSGATATGATSLPAGLPATNPTGSPVSLPTGPIAPLQGMAN